MNEKNTSEFLSSQGLSETFTKRFWKKVKKTDTCWIWTAALNGKGYGLIGKGIRITKYKDKNICASRASWILHFGQIPEKKEVCHTCDNPKCVRPDHLFLGTHLQNIQDSANKGRMNQGVKNNGCKLSEEEVHNLIYLSSFLNGNELANRFGISHQQVSRIKSGKKWKHINRSSLL